MTPHAGLNYEAHEARDGDVTNGGYSVLLPDGRTQHVTYNVGDGYTGYIADVKYSGEAKPYKHKPAPKYKPKPTKTYKPAPIKTYKPVPIETYKPAPIETYKPEPTPKSVYKSSITYKAQPTPKSKDKISTTQAPEPSNKPTASPIYYKPLPSNLL